MSHGAFENCIKACEDCAEACEHCATACLGEKDISKMADCIRLDRDCADLCRMAAALMSRDSRFAGEFCAMLARVCDACGEECGRHASMKHCAECAAACKRCADECRKMGRNVQPPAGPLAHV
jgi:hypothetical protein